MQKNRQDLGRFASPIQRQDPHDLLLQLCVMHQGLTETENGFQALPSPFEFLRNQSDRASARLGRMDRESLLNMKRSASQDLLLRHSCKGSWGVQDQTRDPKH